ncbi:MAG: hypothetical protein SWH61_12285 [Thermodesulfobacteriota bacterium]|nr:hypothetical protein [Thermodesulfobacteriota bacterium]
MKISKQHIIAVVLVVAGLTVGLVYDHMRVTNTRASFEFAINTVDRRNDLYQKKHAEQKAIVAQMQRTADRIKEETKALEQETTFVSADLDAAVNHKASLAARLETDKQMIETAKSVIEQLRDDYDLLKVEQKTRQKDYKTLVAAHETEERKLVTENKELARRFDGTLRVAEGCLTKNAGLCLVIDGIQDAFQDKGVASSLLAKEPITQLRQVHVEKVVQHYEEKIREFRQDPEEWDRHY